MLEFIIPTAWAGEAGAQGAAGLGSMLPMLVIFVLLFYFLLIRPQSKRAKEHRKLVAELQIGDEVVTAGGIIGKISRQVDDFVIITISDKVEITLQKSSITTTLPKGTIKTI